MKGGRRKVRLTFAEEQGEEDFCFIAPDEGPTFSGDDDEDLICCRCDRLLVRGIRRDAVCGVLKRDADTRRKPEDIPNRGTAVENRPFPLLIQCDCGTFNRIWPIIPV